MSPYFRLILIAFSTLVCGCASNADRIDSTTRAAGLTRSTFAHDGFRTFIYLRANDEQRGALTVFIEGDGVPWEGGMRPSADPTARRALALDLLRQTAGRVAYITRPCYHELRDAKCTIDRWTGGRYSEEIVAVMAAAVRDAARQAHASEVVLVGYSGGGVLAVLVAERISNVRAVVTVAANLDIDAWARHHGYLPLSESLNPARSEREHAWREIHFQGERDVKAPPASTEEYFRRFSSARREVIADYDHVCCWVEAWPQLIEQSEVRERSPPYPGSL